MAFTTPQRRALRRRLSREYFWSLGYHGLWKTGQTAGALEAFRRGLTLYPCDPSFWKTYLLATVRAYAGLAPSPQS